MAGFPDETHMSRYLEVSASSRIGVLPVEILDVRKI
jgi:hypothetical protein